MMLTKKECVIAFNGWKKACKIGLIDVVDERILLQLIDEHFALIELFGLNEEYEKVEFEDKEELKKLIEDNCKLWEHDAKLFNEERRKFLQEQIELLEKELNNIKQTEE